MKFDAAFLQPNYFFPAQKPDYTSYFDRVISYAKSKNMALEMEFDERALKKNSQDYRADRLRDYLRAFDSYGIIKSFPIAYYQSDCMVYSLKSSIYEEDRALYNELCTMRREINMGYMNKSLVMFSFLTLLAISCASSRKKPIIKENGVIADMVLMYYGGAHRQTEWNEEQCMKNVAYRDKKGDLHWMFDGFLFLEFKDGKGRSFASYYEPMSARKSEWKGLCDKYFQKGKALDAIESCIDDVKKEIGAPRHARKVVLTLPEPVPNQKDWGELNGRQLDFSNEADRINACKWYIDYAIDRFKKAQFENISLDGFYWIAEEATNSRTILNEIGAYMRSLGYKFYWIPYWGSDGHGEWKELKFDVAYQQPNYFFYEQKPDSMHLKTVCEFAKEKGMYLEVEFDERALKKSPDYRADRLHEYMEAYEKYGALYDIPLAYYIGDCMVYDLATSSYKEDNDLYNWFADIVVKRQHIRGEK